MDLNCHNKTDKALVMLEEHVTNLYYTHGLQVSQAFVQHLELFIVPLVHCVE